MRTKQSLFLFLIVVSGFFSCQKWQEDQLDATKKQTLYEIKYGSHARNTLNIALPANRNTQTPVVIFIHGGAWVGGDKGVFATEMNVFADAGIACASMNYRFANDAQNVHHPELPEDIRKAVDFLASKSNQYQISPSRFGLVGHSAGGHLSLLSAYMFNSDQKIKACASWAGPVDLIDPEQYAISIAPQIFDIYVGHPLQTANDTLLYKEASPYWLVNANCVPSMLVYADEDELVPYGNGVKMHQKLNDLGIETRFETLNGASHTWVGNHLSHARNTTLAWFQEKL